MRRLSEKHKRWLVRHAERSEHRRLRRQKRLPTRRIPRQVHHLSLPAVLSFERNYREAIDFFNKLRQAAERRVPLRIDFTTLREVGPAAMLVLAAELDCWRLRQEHRIRVIDITNWDQGIRGILDNMGLFDLVKVSNPPPPVGTTRLPLHFIRFKSSNLADGDLAVDLRTDLEAVTGKIPGWQHLYRGLAEAMTNVRQHAYPQANHENTRYNKVQKWWMCGAYNDNTKVLTCSFFDRGVGIPKTLPKTHGWEKIRGVLSGLGLMKKDDASLIAAATAMGRTRTGAKHQGRGLADVMEFVRKSQGGKLRILSRRGQYIYEKEGHERASPLPLSIGGTLIEWEITLQQTEVGDDGNSHRERLQSSSRRAIS